MDAPLVLGFDTAAAHCAAALLSGGRVLAAREEPMAKGQAERLMPLCEELLAEAGAGWGDLAGIGVGVGPGNFTGARIGVAAARGLALGLGVPAIGVTAFEAFAFGHPTCLVALDGRLGLAHLQGFGAAAMGPLSASLDALPTSSPGTLVLGDLADEAARRMAGAAAAPLVPLAEAIARIALGRLGTPQPRPAPLYLRPPDAAPPREAPPLILPS